MTFTQPVAFKFASLQVGSLVMDIVDYEIGRHAQWSEDVARRMKRERKAAAAAGGENGGGSGEALEAAEAKFSSFVAKQGNVQEAKLNQPKINYLKCGQKLKGQ